MLANKRRSREYGLYNVLGMDKRNLAHIHFWETAIIAGISLAAGLIFEIVFSKLAELWMVNILNGQTDFKLRIEGSAIRETILVFLVIFITYSIFRQLVAVCWHSSRWNNSAFS